MSVILNTEGSNSLDLLRSWSFWKGSRGLQQKQSIQLYQHTTLPTGSASCLKRRTCWHDWYLCCCTSEAHNFTAWQILDTWNKSAGSASSMVTQGLQGSKEPVSVYLYPHLPGLLRCWATPPNTLTPQHFCFCRTLVVSATVWNPRSSSGMTWHLRCFAGNKCAQCKDWNAIPTNYANIYYIVLYYIYV